MKNKALENELISIHIALDELNDDMADWENMNLDLQRQLTEIAEMLRLKSSVMTKKVRQDVRTGHEDLV